MRDLKNIRSITGKVIFNGVGSINNDSNEQQKTLQALGLYRGNFYKNMTFHKKEFFKENGENKFKFKVSHDCIRHQMFSEEMPYYNSGIVLLPQVLLNHITTPHMIARGYMFTEGDKTIKKTSVFTITDALSQDTRDIVIMDVNSRAGDRGEKTETTYIDENGNTKTDKKSSTSFHYSENVGQHKYEASLGINFDEMQFIPIDDFYNRCSVDLSGIENKNYYLSSMKRNFGTGEDVDIKPYFLKTSTIGEETAEEGILLTQKMVNKVVHVILEKIIQIKRETPSLGGLFNFDSMVLTVNFNDGTNETIAINSLKDLEGLFFSYEQVYIEADEERIAKRDAEIKRLTEEKNNKKKNSKKESNK